MSVPSPATVFFGGSFDPIHNGHLHIARAVHRDPRFGTVLFVPNKTNPLKGENPGASADHRFNMISAAVEHLDWCFVSRAEIDYPGPSYTVDTIERLVAERALVPHPGMIIGDDLVEQLPRWHDYERLMDLVTVLLVRRHQPERSGSRERPTGVGDTGTASLPDSTVFVDNERIEISSTEIRKRLGTGVSITELVPRNVYEYIRKHQLYR